MSLGGYKFVGKYCEKGSLTDQQWALRMHKTKVAAFMAANALANAGWDYDMTGSPDGNYHCLDTVGNNYVTCFKRVVDESTTHYFCLFTLTKYGGTSVTTTGYVATNRFARGAQGNFDTSTTYYLGACYASCFVRYGTSPFSYSTAATQLDDGQSYLLPVGNPGYRTSWSTSDTCDGSRTLLAVSTNYYGFAVKGSSIITFTGPSVSGVAVSLLSLEAFSSKFVDGGNALADTLMINTQGIASNKYEKDDAYHVYSSSIVVASCPNGSQNATDSFCIIDCDPLAFYVSTNIQAYPFQSVSVKTWRVDSTAKTIARGTVNVDLLAVNYPASLLSKFTTFANGKYLVLDGVNESQNTPQKLFGQVSYPSDHDFYTIGVYCGWDPSNPDITQASSWQLYDET